MPLTIDKQQLHNQITQTLRSLVDNAQRAVERAYEAATHEENIAENKYDTLGLEASYLTEGQARRLTQCQADLQAYEELTPKAYTENDAIGMGALLHLLDEEQRSQMLFLGPAAGGVKVSIEDSDIVIITPSSPLGKAVLKAYAGDEISVQIGGKVRTYEIDGVQ
jgi:transcription elongation GreA/GreB family factor